MTISRNLSFLAEGVSPSGVLGATYGGTGQSSITTGDLLYGSASNTISKLAIGSTGTILRVVAGVPSWGTDYTGTVTSVAATVPSFLSISGSPITSSGTLAITYSGTALPTANGGTALTSFTNGGVLYASSTSALATGSALTFDGSNLTVVGGGAVKGNKNSSAQFLAFVAQNSTQNYGTYIDQDNVGSNSWSLFDTTNSQNMIRYYPGASGYWQLYTNGGERIRIDSSGNLLLGTTTSLSGTSNIVPAATKGINFTANTPQAGMTTQLLNWYEEGTFTPTVTFATAGDLAVTYNVNQRQGSYTRIGNMVFVIFAIGTSSFTYTTASGALRITGLPFTAKTDTGIQNIGSTVWGGITKVGYTQVVPRVSTATNLIDFIASGSGVTQASVTSTDVPTTSTVVLRGTIVYEV